MQYVVGTYDAYDVYARQGAAGPERSERVRASAQRDEDGTPKAPGAGAISAESRRQVPKKLEKNRGKVWGYCAGVCTFGGKVWHEISSFSSYIISGVSLLCAVEAIDRFGEG